MKKILVFILILSLLVAGCSLRMLDAAREGDIGKVKDWLNKGADINVKGYQDATALIVALTAGHIDIAKFLIEKGADVNVRTHGDWNPGWTVLMRATMRGDMDIVKLLIEKGADINARSRNGQTALMLAAGVNAMTYVAPLQKFEADLMSAAVVNIEIVKLLIEKGADVNARSNNGCTALISAAMEGHTEIVKLLIEKGANIDSAIVGLEGFIINNSVSAPKYRQAISLIERMKPKQEIVSQPQPSQSISKEELKTIVQAAVESAKVQKEEKKTIIQSDIDKPAFAQSERIMGDNDLAVIIGIEGYQGLPKSDYSYDDARLVADYAKALGFKPRNIEILLDERATKSAIEKIIKTWLPNKARPDSRVFIYYSGHGAPDPKTGSAYLVPYDGDPNYLSDTGYPLKSLYDNLGKLQSAEVTVLLDSCFSGAGGRSVLAKGARPLVMMAETGILPQNIAVLSATQGTQISTSSPENGHGIFTYYFLKALKDGKKNIAEIYEYIKPLVEDEAKTLNVQQSPSINPDVEKIKGRFGLRR